jgi:plastocyanin
MSRGRDRPVREATADFAAIPDNSAMRMPSSSDAGSVRRLHLLTPFAAIALLTLAACAGGSTAGWTYAPAPSKAPAPSGSGVASASGSAQPSGSGSANVVVISAVDIKYEQDTLTAPAGTPFQIQFENKDAGVPHNVSLHTGGSTGAEIFKGTIFNGVETRTYDIGALDAGAYAFVCSVHPTMIGTLNVE